MNFRNGPGTSYSRITVLAAGRGLVATGRSQNAFYQVTAGGNTGWVHGAYLVLVSGTTPSEVPTVPGQIVDSFVSDGTGYYPSSSALEGGFNDRRGAPLRTLQQYLAGNADYVSVATPTPLSTVPSSELPSLNSATGVRLNSASSTPEAPSAARGGAGWTSACRTTAPPSMRR